MVNHVSLDFNKGDDDPKSIDEQQFLKYFNLSDVDSGFQPTDINRFNEQWFRLTTAICYGILAVAGLICNCVFCFVIWRSKKLHTVTHMLMTNLASSNILFLLFHPPFFMSTYILQNNWMFGKLI